ncbi:AI-2E family transporter [Roseiconus nitratireducens]|uniref:AI-2E family transporter n=1 Tax=Roseiconus nitratireducens TaxID=2605748 RepID=A0A5M6D579_9BACT|nr:AI-2E family transporter [Roseiconus nitratireducens]KAA5542654.1 AI-2E family transporter [Roseiconus nitratireducens]
MNRRSVVTQWIMTSVAACLALYFASEFLVPITIALLGYLTLRNLVVRMCKLGVPRTLSAMLTMIILVAIGGTAIVLLYSPAQQWLTTAPATVGRVQEKIRQIRQPLETIDKATEELNSDASEDAELEVQVDQPQLISSDVVLTRTGNMLLLIAVIAVTTFFLLATGDEILNRGLRILPTDEDRDKAIELASNIHDAVGSYLMHITVINIGLGIVVSVAMWLLGMPTPVLWGAIATLFNFVPYVGPLAASGVVFIAAVGEFDSFTYAAGVAVVFWLITAVEGQFVTPSVLGKNLELGPVVVLISVAFWGFMWGIPGVFIAVPLVIAMRLVFDCFETTKPVATLLGSSECEPPDCDQQLEDHEELAEMASAD